MTGHNKKIEFIIETILYISISMVWRGLYVYCIFRHAVVSIMQKEQTRTVVASFDGLKCVNV